MLAGVGEFLLVTGQDWMMFGAFAAAYVLWVCYLRQLPRPGSTAQWESFRLWMEGVREYQQRQRDNARRERQARIKQLREQLNRVLHWK